MPAPSTRRTQIGLSHSKQGRIGVFDSGLGGLTVFRNIRDLLPHYDYLYLGDNARAPYGSRSFDSILQFAWEGVRYLLEKDCQLVIIACNTASARALRTIQQRYLPTRFPDKRVLGVIRPAVETLGRLSLGGNTALWATAGTVASNSYALEVKKLHPGIRLVQVACPVLVPLIEAGERDSLGLLYYLKKYWDLTKQQMSDVDTLLLGCTHYPLIEDAIRSVIPDYVNVISQGPCVAASLQDYLFRHPEIECRVTRNAAREYITTEQAPHFDQLAMSFLGEALYSTHIDLKV